MNRLRIAAAILVVLGVALNQVAISLREKEAKVGSQLKQKQVERGTESSHFTGRHDSHRLRQEVGGSERQQLGEDADSEGNGPENATAAANNAGATISEHNNSKVASDLAAKNAGCRKVPHCFCMSNSKYATGNMHGRKANIDLDPLSMFIKTMPDFNTDADKEACGWCDSSLVGMFGNKDGPLGNSSCPQAWIFDRFQCPRYWCPDDFNKKWFCLDVLPVIVMLSMTILTAIRNRFKKEDPPPESKVKGTKRTFEAFQQGSVGFQPPKPDVPYQHDAPVASAAEVFRTAFHSPIMTEMSYKMLKYGSLVSIIVFLVKFRLPTLTSEEAKPYKGLIKGLAEISSSTTTVGGFFFSFYTLRMIGHWFDILRRGWAVQGNINGTALFLGGLLNATKSPEDTWETKWNAYRYLMLIFYFEFKGVSERLGSLSNEDMKDCGFLTDAELLLLEKSITSPRHTVLQWLQSLMIKAVKKFYPTDGGIMVQNALAKIEDLRGNCAGLRDDLSLRAPWSFQAWLYSVVYIQMMLLPFAELNQLTYHRKDVITIGVTSTTMSCVMTFGFFLSMFALLEAFKHPYGLHLGQKFALDQMNPEALFLSSEGQIIDFLTSPSSKAIADIDCLADFS